MGNESLIAYVKKNHAESTIFSSKYSVLLQDFWLKERIWTPTKPPGDPIYTNS